MEPDAQSNVTRLLVEMSQGDSNAAGRLLPLVYDELRNLAASYFRRQRADHTLQPTALVHEAFLKLIDQTQARWNDRAHFFAVAATAMRHILVNHAVAQGTVKRGGGRKQVALDDAVSLQDGGDVDMLALDEALKRLAAADERKQRIVELRFFAGLTMEEIAGVLDVSKTTVENDWRAARAWLNVELSKGS